jgi:hypothetical protein
LIAEDAALPVQGDASAWFSTKQALAG